MSAPNEWAPWPSQSLERSREDLLASMRPLPPPDEMLIEDLTEEEDRVFMETVQDA